MSGPAVLNLNRLEVRRLPGLDRPFAVEARPGVNLVLGPNESGKSSLVRAVFHLMWPVQPTAAPFSVRGEFTDAVGPLHARCDDAVSVHWTRAGDPVPAPEVPAADLARCYRLGLLDVNRREGNGLDQHLATEIRRQMSGGYDLAGLRALFPDQNARWARRQMVWHKARQELLACAGLQRNLAGQERGLADLESDRDLAQSAGRRAERLAAAQTHQRLTAELDALAARLAEMPTGMPFVRPGDDDALHDLQARLTGKARQIATLREGIDRRAGQINELTGLGTEDGLDLVVREAEAQAGRVAEAARNLAAAAAAAQDARQALSPELLAAGLPAASAEAFAQLARIHRETSERQAQASIVARLQEAPLLQEPGAPAGRGFDREAHDLLLGGQLQAPTRTLLVTGLMGLIGAAVLLVLGGSEPEGSRLGARVVGLVLLLGVYGGGNVAQWLRGRRRHRHGRRRLEELGRAAGAPLPAGWTRGDALEILLAQAAATGHAAAGTAVRAGLRDDLQRRRDEAEAELQAAVDRRQALLQELGQSTSRDDPGLLQELKLVSDCRAAESRRLEAQGLHDHEQALLAGQLAAAQRRLRELGLDVPGTVLDLRLGLEDLRRRRQQLQILADTQVRDENELEQAAADHAAAEQGLVSLVQRLGLGTASGADDTAHSLQQAVEARVAVLERYTELRRQQERLQEERERALVQLGDENEQPTPAELLGRSAADLAAQLVREERLASGAEALTAGIIRIGERIEQARRGQEWEQARALEAEQAADLTDLLDERRHNALGRLLLDTIEERHEQNTQPPLLTGMNEHLVRFTGGNYRLRVAAAGDGSQRFVAVDNEERRLELSELSDGTRSQLLLAARLAYVTQNESGLLVPLILDEALTASDPGRFEAIAGALGLLAADSGRQVFYLTSSPADVAAWQQALAGLGQPAGHVIDLAQVRGIAGAADAANLAAPEKPDVPTPNGNSAAEYGVRLRVPPVLPWQHESRLHLFHLWKDDLGLVHRLRVGGVATLGHWQRLGLNLVRAGLVTDAEANRIEARNQLYGAFVDAWRVGRGRPFGREELVASGALSAAMLPPALAVLKTANGRGAAFMQAVHEGRIKRLNRSKKEALQEFLERESHLDQREIWSADAVVAHVLGRLERPLAAGLLAADEVRLLVLDLYRVAGA